MKFNLKMTDARREIIKLLEETIRPICYEDIKGKISMDKATFYRNISKFQEQGIINSIESNDKKRYYELTKTPHAHFICKSCNTIECINSNLDISIDRYKIEDIILKGVCAKCSI